MATKTRTAKKRAAKQQTKTTARKKPSAAASKKRATKPKTKQRSSAGTRRTSRKPAPKQTTAKTAAPAVPVLNHESLAQLLPQLVSPTTDSPLFDLDGADPEQLSFIRSLLNALVDTIPTGARRHSRIDTKLNITIRQDKAILEADTRDLSIGGVFVISDQLLSPGDVVDFEVRLPDAMPPVTGKGLVVRVVNYDQSDRHPGFGMQFVKLEIDVVREYIRGRLFGQFSPEPGERRQYARLKRTLKARFLAIDSVGTGRIRDIGLGGVLLEAKNSLKPGTAIRLLLVHPLTLQTITLSGAVVRMADPPWKGAANALGVAFDDPPRMEISKLERFLDDFLRLEGAAGS